jgi:hypothetical protein
MCVFFRLLESCAGRTFNDVLCMKRELTTRLNGQPQNVERVRLFGVPKRNLAMSVRDVHTRAVERFRTVEYGNFDSYILDWEKDF